VRNRTIAAIALLVSCTAGLPLCAQPAAPPAAMSNADRADHKAVTKWAGNGRSVQFDMTNPLHYRFYRKQLALAGLNETTSPQLFRAIEAARQRKGPMAMAAAAGDGTGGPIPVNFIADLSTSNQQNFTSNALSSIPGGSEVTVLTLGIYDQNSNPLGTIASTQSFNEGTDTTVAATGALSTRPPGPTPVTATMTSYYQDKQGNPYQVGQSVTTTYFPQTIVSTAPNSSTNQIKVCLNRSQVFADCTYDCSHALNCNQTPPSTTNMVFPVIGSVTYNGNIDPIRFQNGQPTNAFNSTTVTMIDPSTGGGCPMNLSTSFFSDPNTIVNGATLSWNMNPAQFGTACYQQNTSATYAFSTYVEINSNVVWAFINNTGTTPTQNTLQIPAMYIALGCIAEGSRVTMADGSERRIEAFDSRERVLSDAAKRVLTVDNISRGIEIDPMVRIKTARGLELLLTKGHPVVTADGVRVAKRLKIGDSVVTLEGSDTLISVTREKFDGTVWNLDLGTAEDHLVRTNTNTTFFANGILVGDGHMQAYWEREDRRNKQSVLDALPKEWHQDYFNWLAAQKK